MVRLITITFWLIVYIFLVGCEKTLIEIEENTQPVDEYIDIYGSIYDSIYYNNDSIENIIYEFNMVGRTYLDNNGYYHINLIDPEISGIPQTLHKFGAYVTNFDKYGLPTMCVWACDRFWYTPDTLGTTYIEIGQVPTGESPWSFENFVVTGYGGMTVPVVNGTSYADPNIDSVFCMMAPVWEMRFDTITIHGQAWFEEGDIILTDSIQVILN